MRNNISNKYSTNSNSTNSKTDIQTKYSTNSKTDKIFNKKEDKMPTGTVMAYSIPDGAKVLIDGTLMFAKFGEAKTPTIIPEVPAGKRYITFRLYGYVEETKIIDVPQDGYITVTAILHPITKPLI
jgi:hypothetical protein